MSTQSLQDVARHEAETMPLDQIDPSRFDYFARDTVHHYFNRLRREDPVHWTTSPDFGGFWSVTKYKDIMAVDMNHKVFSSHFSLGGVTITNRSAQSFITMDPPQHDAPRTAVSPIVAPANLNRLEPLIRERTAKVLDNLPRGQEFDWVPTVSVKLTGLMLATLFDMPEDDHYLVPEWTDMLTSFPGVGGRFADDAEKEVEVAKMVNYLLALWNAKVNAEPTPDLISMLAHNPTTRHMTPAEFAGTMTLLVIGGNDTTRNSMSGGLLALNENPAEYDKLRANHALIEPMVSEVIRWQTPLAHMRRTATEDIDLGGKTIAKGDKVVMWYVSGNRDDEVIEKADQFIIDRARPRQHLSFGFGVHRCVGNRLAEMQLKILWEEILARFDRIEVTGTPVRTRHNFVRGIDSLPVHIHA